jgi:protocatechuate 3,4-dioxygenase beta subunit
MKRRGYVQLGLGAALVAGVAYWQRNSLARLGLTNVSNGVTAVLAPEAGANVSVLTPEQTSGPYHIKSALRANIREGRPGLPLRLTIEVVNMPNCAVLEGVTVEIWHCDARGHYSGYGNAKVRAPFDTLANIILNQKNGSIPPVDSDMFMRGGQVTDANGRVTFETVFPGWYDPRVTHIHAKVSRDGETFLTTQLYFPDEMVADIYANHPDYKDYGACPYNLTSDLALRDVADQTGVVLTTERSVDQVTASVRFAIA